MSKLRMSIIGAAIALPLLAIGGPLKGHPHLEKARSALNEAEKEISESQKANEKVWGDEGGHGKAAKEAIAKAKSEIELAAEWVNSHEKK